MKISILREPTKGFYSKDLHSGVHGYYDFIFE